ncbi:MAG: 6-deoxy-6-sulfogluconolactonase [Paracidovorax wautersii]|uniref:6-deoxy-6-sulfogluconolactonase n=1 Tax=Paracidovorax wautersii TaxID=1177982 RepID=A0A7V8FNZ9_9BURK|nr:MAG: 6-deoxy-6-sulfogluconolactonase [Paracidovorax wautersii]
METSLGSNSAMPIASFSSAAGDRSPFVTFESAQAVRQVPASRWTVASAGRNQLGESIYWSGDEQRLYWLDIPGRQLLRAPLAAPDDANRCVLAASEAWDLPQEAGCVAPVRGGGWVLAMRDGVYLAREWGGALACLVRFNHDPATMRFNDGKCDDQGRLWAGTLFEPKTSRRAELYSIDGREGSPLIELKALNAITANGLAWSPDFGRMYWADTPQHAVFAWDSDTRTNTLRHHRVFAHFPEKPAGWQPGADGYLGRPDGATVDAQGYYYVAMFEGARVLRLAPDGRLDTVFHLPVQCPTMPCLGGPDGRTLFVTTASKGRPAQELSEQPAGQVLALRVDVPGLPVQAFARP